MIRDVTEFRRAEVGCLWVDELETPVGAWRAARRRTGRRDGARICTFPVPPAATDSAGHRVLRVPVRRAASPPCPAEGVAPDRIPDADHGHQRPPGRTAPAAGSSAAPGPTRHATAATLSMGELLARAARRDPIRLGGDHPPLQRAGVGAGAVVPAAGRRRGGRGADDLAAAGGELRADPTPRPVGRVAGHHRHPGVPADPAPHPADRDPSTASPTPSPTPPPARSGPSSTPKPPHAVRALVAELPPRSAPSSRPCSTREPAPTPRSPATPASRSAASDRPAPAPCTSCGGCSTERGLGHPL